MLRSSSPDPYPYYRGWDSYGSHPLSHLDRTGNCHNRCDLAINTGGALIATYSFSTRTSGPIEEARDRVIAALAGEGFGVLTESDVGSTLKVKLGEDIPPYLILGACNPPLAHRALSAEPEIGTLLPCNVVLRSTEDSVTVDFMDPQSVLGLVDNAGLVPVATEVRQRLERVAAAVS